jgi:hypothetical protein
MFGGKSFNPETDIPDLSGKVILVTGGEHGMITRLFMPIKPQATMV